MGPRAILTVDSLFLLAEYPRSIICVEKAMSERPIAKVVHVEQDCYGLACAASQFEESSAVYCLLEDFSTYCVERHTPPFLSGIGPVHLPPPEIILPRPVSSMDAKIQGIL